MSDPYAKSIAIVYPTVFPEATELPIDRSIDAHCTLMYLGEIGEVSFTKDDLQEVLSRFTFEDLGIVDVDGLTLFGKDKDVLVMLLKSSVLEENHAMISAALHEKGIESASYFTDYKPHVTLNEKYHGPTVGYELPTTIGLGSPVVWWGDDRE